MNLVSTLRRSARRHRDALTLNLHPEEVRLSIAALPLLLHLLGMGAIARLTHRPAWLLLPVVLLAQPLLVSLKRRRLHLLSASFAPLALPYAVLALRLAVAFVARAQGLTTGSLTVPEPWSFLLNLDRATLLGGIWVLLAQSSVTAQTWGRSVRWLPLGDLVRRHGRALTFRLRLDEGSLPLRHGLGLLALHGFALVSIVRFTSQRLWYLLVPLLLLQPLLLSLKRRPRPLAESLAPLLLPYLVLLPRAALAVSVYLHGTHVWPLVPPPWDEVLNLEMALFFATLWTLVAQAGPTTRAFGQRMGWRRALGYTLAAVALIWAAPTYLSLRTHGATGTDPYAYTQMAVDIADHALPLHTFDQVPGIADLSLPLEGAVPLGHFVLEPETGLSATVWPPGHSALLAAGYRLLGEVGLYVVNPLLGLATLVATWLLCNEVLYDWPRDDRLLAAGVAVFLLATSYEQVDRLLVPMADVSSQLFTTLTLYFTLRATRERSRDRTFAVLSGLALGLAFDVRYTQVLMAPAVAYLFFAAYRDEGWKQTGRALAYAAWAAWLAAMPVLAYHRLAFGHPFSVGSTELEAFGWASLPVTTVRMLGAFFRPNEFLHVAPLLAWGLWQLWRRSRRTTTALLLGVGVIVGFHLFYRALRLRDLLAVFPVLALCAGVGLADILARVDGLRPAARRWRVRALSFLLVATLLRTGSTLLLPFPPMHFNTFGYLLGDQRRAFDTLATLVPPEATVAASLNAGAVELYADRDAVRPEVWSPEQWLTYVEATLAEGDRLFVLMDGRRMEAPLDQLRERYRLDPVGSLPLPYFYPDGGSLNREVPLYEVGKATGGATHLRSP